MSQADPTILGLGLVLVAIVLVVCIVMGRRIEAKIGMVHFELKPNGGKTVRDAIDRHEKRLLGLEKAVKRIEKALTNDS